MKKTKRLILLIGVALTMLAPLSGLFPFFEGRVSAVTDPAGGGAGTTYTADEIEAQLKSYVYMHAFADCIDWNKSSYWDSHQTVDGEQATNWVFFDKGETQLGLFDGDDYNGMRSCNDPNWVRDAFSLWGVQDPIEAICNSGFQGDAFYSVDTPTSVSPTCADADSYGIDDKTTLNTFKKYINGLYYKSANSTAWPLLTNSMSYMLYRYDFEKLCKATADPSLDDLSDTTIWKNPRYFRLTDADGVTKISYSTDSKHNHDTPIKAYIGDNLAAVTKSCKELAEGASLNAPVFAINVPDGLGSSSFGSGNLDSADGIGLTDDDCGGFSLNPLKVLSGNWAKSTVDWLVCGFVKTMSDAVKGFDGAIAGMLCIDESDIFSGATSTCSSGGSSDPNSSAGFYAAWNTFRILALGLLVIGGLVMIISQGLGFEIFDAYTVKKTLPRILFAGIAISLSWQFLQFVVTLSNGLGIGIRALIYQPFLSSGIDGVALGSKEFGVGAVLGLGGLAVFGALGLLSFVGTALLAILIAFIVIVIRNIVVILLIIIAPLALAAYILPNTEKYTKNWWEWLFKALLMFPMITGLIAVGHVFAAITSAKGGTFSSFLALAAYVTPYFLIPLTFRFAGGLMATLGGFANDRSRGGFDRLKKYRSGQSEKRLGYYGQKYGNRITQKRAEAVRKLNESASGRSRLTGAAMRFAGRKVGGLGDIEERMSAIQAAASKRANDQIATGKDDSYRGLTVSKRLLRSGAFEQQLGAQQAAMRAGTLRDEDTLVRDNDGTRQYRSLGGAWVNEADVLNAHQEYKGDVGAQQAALSYEMRKAAENNQVDGLTERFTNVANGWGMTKNQAQGAWIGAGFENQNQHLALKYTKLDFDGSGKVAGSHVDDAGLLTEMYEKKGSYPLSQMSAHTIDVATQAATQARARLLENPADATAQADFDKAKSVAETFMHQLGGGQRDDGGAPLEPNASTTSGSARMVNASGAGHVNEAVYRLARETGVITTPPNNPQSPGSPQTNPPRTPGS
ncbi:MAG: rane protein of unknown function [Candidatus Saccharibacteria bacterium]|nr:rane protein of unknown function [Candidatus Saccharibacteria bacterium]